MEKQAFWAGTHPLSSLQESLHGELVPAAGRAPTLVGELLRSMTNLYYDVYNNGFGNRDVPAIAQAVSFVESYRTDLAPYLERADTWQRDLDSILATAGQMEDDEDAPEHARTQRDVLIAQAQLALEDITTAVVKYVAEKTDRKSVV